MKGSVELDRRVYDEGFFGKNGFWDFYYFSLHSLGKSLKRDHLESLVGKPCIWGVGNHLTSSICLRNHNVRKWPAELTSDSSIVRDH